MAVSHLCPVKTAERINIRFGVEILGDGNTVLIGAADHPMRKGEGNGEELPHIVTQWIDT